MRRRIRVRSYRRRSKKGTPHIVRSHDRNVNVKYPYRASPPRKYVVVRERYDTDRLVNLAFTGFKIVYPQYKAVFGTCRHLYNNKEFYGEIFSEVVADKDNEEKIDNLSHILYDKVKEKAISTVSTSASDQVANMIDNKVGFDRIESSIMKSKSSDGNIMKYFFKSSLSYLLNNLTEGN